MSEQTLETRIADLEGKLPEIKNVDVSETLAKFNEGETFSARKMSINSVMPTRADIPMLAAGVGAASSAAVAEYVGAYIKTSPSDQISVRAVGKIAGGWLLYKLGGDVHELVGAFGGGVLIAGISDAVTGLGYFIRPKGPDNIRGTEDDYEVVP